MTKCKQSLSPKILKRGKKFKNQNHESYRVYHIEMDETKWL